MKIFSFFLTVLLGLYLCSLDATAQNCTQLGLPDTALARLCNRAGADVIDLDYSPDGETLASVLNWPRQLVLWDVASRTEKLTIYDINGHSVKFSPDGSTFVCGDVVYDALTGEPRLILANGEGYTHFVVYSPDGSTLAGAGERGLRFWSVLVEAPSPDEAPINVLPTDPAAAGPTVLVRDPIATSANTVPDIRGLAYAPDGSELVVATSVGIWIYDPVLNEEVALMTKDQGGHTDSVVAVAYSPDGYTLASAGDYGDNTIRLWDAQTKKHKFTFSIPKVPGGFFYYLRSLAFSPDSKTLVSTDGSADSQVHLWDAVNGEYRYTFPGHNGRPWDAVFSPDGKTIASGADDNIILLWDFESYPVLSISPDFVATLTGGEELAFEIKIANGKNVSGYQLTLEFDPDTLVYKETDYGDYIVQGVPVQPIVHGHQGTVELAALSLSSVGSDGDGTLATVKFDVKTGQGSKLTFRDVLLSDSTGKTSYAWVGDASLINAPIGEDSDCPINNAKDVNKDCVVNIQDLIVVATHFGHGGDIAADVNGDRKVNIVDLTLVAAAFSDAAGAPALSANTHEMVSAANIQEWLKAARQVDGADPVFQRGVLHLEQLLRVLESTETTLLANYPNPFNPETWIPYRLVESTDVRISICTSDGTLVRTLLLGHQPAGLYESRSRAAYWDGRNEVGEPVASGLYFYTLTAGEFTATRKMLIRK